MPVKRWQNVHYVALSMGQTLNAIYQGGAPLGALMS